MAKRDVADRLKEFEALCHKRGLPVTTQRQTIYASLLRVDTHPSADQVFEMVRHELPAISRTTVYRVLEVLSREGFILRLPHPSSKARYDGNTKRHHHMVCRACGLVLDVFDARYDALPLPQVRGKDFHVEDYGVTFTGTCASCRN